MESENLSKNGWSEYGRLVLKELERLNNGQEDVRRELDRKCQELSQKMSELKKMEKDIEEYKKWKDSVTEVWSTTQMKESKDQIYKQKDSWEKVIGITIAIQVIGGLIITFLKFKT